MSKILINLDKKMKFYIWFDTFLEETFVAEENLDINLKNVFEQLKKEKIIVYELEAENKKEALKIFDEKYSNASLVIKNNSKLLH
jgi:hypothetical protein